MMPGTRVFCGDPLMNGEPSRMAAAAKMFDGDTSASDLAIERRTSSAVAFRPARTSTKRSVLAVHRTTTVSSLFVALN